MSEVVLRIEGKELVLDDSAVTGLNIRIDHEQVPCAEYGCGGCGWVHRRQLPTSHLTLDFGDGKQPQWREPGGIAVSGSGTDGRLTTGDLRAFLARCDGEPLGELTVIEALDPAGGPGVDTGGELTAIRIRP